MKSYLKWTSELPEQDKEKAINCLCYSPTGTHLIVSSSNRLLMFDALSGVLLKKLPQGHKGTIYTISYSYDGKRFATGGADNLVIIWTTGGDGKLRYPHNDSIQAVAYNPVTQQLASCSSSDFGLYSPEQTEVRKYRVKQKITSCSWTNDGQHLAIGHFNGIVTIVNRLGEEQLTIQRSNEDPVWTVRWNPCRDEPDILALGQWDKTLSFYHLSGRQIGKDRRLGYDPCCITFFKNGEYFLMGGSDRKCTLWKKQGIKLSTICEESDWVWSSAKSPTNNFVAVGTEDGKVKVYHLLFPIVHGLHGDIYAYRDSMTDIIIKDLETENTKKIYCKDYIQKIAVYNNRLAVQLPDKIYIYDLYKNEDEQIMTRIRSKILKKLSCNLLVVTGSNIILCQERCIEMYNFIGVKERMWPISTTIKYIKVYSGPIGNEGILIGTGDGSVFLIFLQNAFPIELIKHNQSIRCCDLCRKRNKLAIVDEKRELYVYDLESKKVIFKEKDVSTVAWNSYFNNMFCFSKNNVLYIKTEDFPSSEYKFKGLVVGFKGSKIHGLHLTNFRTLDVPHSATLKQYIKKKKFKKAFKIACLGVTEEDWEELAFASLLNLEFEISKKSFIRIRDIKYIDLLHKFEKEIYNKNYNEKVFLGEIHAYMGNFDKAKDMFLEAGKPRMAVDMFCDMRMWEEAQDIAKNLSTKDILIIDLMLRQAMDCEDDGDFKEAYGLYRICGKFKESIILIEKHRWDNWEYDLIDIFRELSKEKHQDEINLCIKILKENNLKKYLIEVFEKLGDYTSLVNVYVETNDWEKAKLLLKKDEALKPKIYIPYAKHLISKGNFHEAIKMLEEAGKPLEVIKMIEIMGHNAIIENRFLDAAKYFVKLALNMLKTIEGSENLKIEEIRRTLFKFGRYQKTAHIYYAYSNVHKYCETPFSSHEPRYLFNMARYLLMNISKTTPFGISKVYIVITLSRLGELLKNFKFSRDSYQRLQNLKIQKRLVDEIELETIKINSKPMSDNEELIPVCYKCSSSNPLITKQDKCNTCGNIFKRCFLSFEHLPLIPFLLPDNMTEEQATMFLETEHSRRSSSGKGGKKEDEWKETVDEEGGVEELNFNDPSAFQPKIPTNEEEDEIDDGYEYFRKLLLKSTSDKKTASKVVKVSEKLFKKFRKEDVYIVKFCKNIRTIYYLNIFPQEISIIQCKECNIFFREDDLDFEILKTGDRCPCCSALLNLKK